MKKIFFLFSLGASLIFFTAFINFKPSYVDKSNGVYKAESILPKSKITLTVTCVTNRIQQLGGSFKHKIKLMNGTSPISHAEVKINDPIGRVCTFVTTTLNGEAIWDLPIPLDTKQQCYAIEFFYENVKEYSTVAVSLASTAIKLPSYSINLYSIGSLDNSNLVIASRGGFTRTQQTINTTIKEGVKFGIAIAKDYLSNPMNIVITTVAAVSCTAGQSLPVAGQAICLTSSAMVKSGLAVSTVKILGSKLVDATNFSEADKENIKNQIELGTIAYSVSTLNPSEGLSNLDALGSTYDFVKNSYSQLIYVNGVLKGASISAQKVGSSEVIMMSIYKKDTSSQIIIKKSKDPNCNENYTGDFCFKNNSDLNLLVTLRSSPSKKFSYTSPYTCTLQPGQQQCFFGVPAGAARYEIKTPATYYTNKPGAPPPPKTYYAQGSLYVDPCQANTFTINIESPSFSSNTPTITNENQNQTSKDPDCIQNYTGDYYFQNSTKMDLLLTFSSSPSKKYSYTSPYTCTLQPGQQQCFFGVPAGAARYEIKTPATYYTNKPGAPPPPKTYYAQGSLYVDPCQANTFLIK